MMDDVQSEGLDALGTVQRRSVLWILRDGPLPLDIVATVLGCSVEAVRQEVAVLTGAGRGWRPLAPLVVPLRVLGVDAARSWRPPAQRTSITARAARAAKPPDPIKKKSGRCAA